MLGLVLAGWANEVLSRQMPDGDGPRLVLQLNLKVLGFAFAASTFSGLVFGLLPAWLASRTNVNDALKQGARGMTGNRARHRLLHATVVTQVAFALALLTGAGVMVRGLDRFASLDPGWRVDGLVAGYLSLPNNKYGSADRRLAFSEQLGEKLAGLPGIDRIAVAGSLPIQGFDISGSFAVEGQLASLKGREPVAIISQNLADQLWPGKDPLGRSSQFPGFNRDAPPTVMVIVGVAPAIQWRLFKNERPAAVYIPLSQEFHADLKLHVRVAPGVDPTRLMITARNELRRLDPEFPLKEVKTLAAMHRDGPNVRVMRLGSRLFGAFGGLALLLSSLGIYGVKAYAVARRTREIGIRMALGANPRDVVVMILRESVWLAGLGLGLGLLLALAVGKLAGSFLYQVHPLDPLTFSVVPPLLLAIALDACWLPARRAAKVDPMMALRHE